MTQAFRLPPNVSFRDDHPDLDDGRESIIAGLRASPPRIDPMWLYDRRGSELFDEITRLPEYYPTRTEIGILRRNAQAIRARCGPDCVFIEPGSGSSDKVRLLLEDLRPSVYVPVDISAAFLREAAAGLGREYPWLPIQAVCADFNAGWEFLEGVPPGRRVIFYPGSTLGNLEPDSAQAFLATLADVVGADGGVLIGVDTHKATPVLEAAYDDATGVTAAFNRNLLTRLNALLDADFDPSGFQHRAHYDEAKRRIEMHLVSLFDQTVHIGAATLHFPQGASIHTENSYKYSDAGFERLARAAGLTILESWHDDQRLFGVHYLAPA